jgi:hypothetical protein
MTNDLFPTLSARLSELENKLAPFQQAKGPRRAINKLVWPFKEGDFKATLTDIERLKSLFGLALQTDHL